jgi:predicted RNA-binding protein
VARIEAEQHGFWLIDFFGKKIFVEATIQTVDLVDEHLVALKNLKPS